MEGTLKGFRVKYWGLHAQLKIADCEPYGISPSGEAAQTPAHGISKRGLGREVRHGLCPLE